ncbi:MAG: hypothetical protein ACP5GW_00265 [Caldisericaceae bacterium]
MAFSYLTLTKQYSKLKDLSSNYSMVALSPSVLVEDFRALSYLAENDIQNALMEIALAQSIDPEDTYSFLLEGILKQSTGNKTEESFGKSIFFARPKDKTALISILQSQENSEYAIMFKIDESSLDEQILEMSKIAESNPGIPYPKLTLAQLYLRKRDIDAASKVLNSVLSLYPYYPRALALAYTLHNDYLSDSVAAQHYAVRLFDVNPISIHRNKIPSFASSEEQSEMLELENIFLTDNPILSFAKTRLEELNKVNTTVLEQPKDQDTNAAYETAKEVKNDFIEDNPQKTQPKPDSYVVDYIELGRKALSDKDFSEAIKYFLKALNEQE